MFILFPDETATGEGKTNSRKWWLFVIALFHAKSEFKRVSEGTKKLPIKNDEESFLVDKTSEISNLELLKDIVRIANLEKGLV